MSVSCLIASIQRVLGRPLFLFPLTVPNIIDFSNESPLMTCPKYVSRWRVIFASREGPGLMRSNTSLLVIFAVHGIRNSLLQHHNSNASIFFRSAFLIVQLSHPYVVMGKTIAFTILIFV